MENESSLAGCLTRTANSLLDAAKTEANEKIATVEARVREAPKQTILMALAAGYLLRCLPIGRILQPLLRLLLVLIKPAIVLAGIVQFAEIAQNCSRRRKES